MFQELDKAEIAARWQDHRRLCLELAIKLGASSAEQAIEFAEKLGAYILHGIAPAQTLDV